MGSHHLLTQHMSNLTQLLLFTAWMAYCYSQAPNQLSRWFCLGAWVVVLAIIGGSFFYIQRVQKESAKEVALIEAQTKDAVARIEARTRIEVAKIQQGQP